MLHTITHSWPLTTTTPVVCLYETSGAALIQWHEMVEETIEYRTTGYFTYAKGTYKSAIIVLTGIIPISEQVVSEAINATKDV